MTTPTLDTNLASDVPPNRTPMTLGRFLALGEDVRAELVDGILVYKDLDLDVTPARFPHGSIASRLLRALGNHADAHDLGEVFDSSTGFVLRREPPLVLVPEVAFVRWERLPDGWADDSAEPPVLAPDLAAEVLSPSNGPAETARKVSRYLEHGVRCVWTVDPRDRTVTVHATGAAPLVVGATETLEGGDVVPGFVLLVASLFAGLRPKR